MSGIDVYEPKEDSFLILKHIKNFAENKTVLDLGTGTGILAIEAAKYAKKVYAVDISKKALAVAKQNAKKANAKNITFLRSDLFSAFKQAKRKPRFDLILFNPPYLPAQPSEPKELALQIAGGKHGYELIERFFQDVSFFLDPDGVILLVFSTLTKKHKVDKIIEEHCFIT
ncbi:MAG TPA: methyltransferase domain-containing protein, partial [Candidatus Woesearchaeota archaeon]|nr:methyltransferase domain-containing protein [Candidatus Woesearchaeota archaeon]